LAVTCVWQTLGSSYGLKRKIRGEGLMTENDKRKEKWAICNSVHALVFEMKTLVIYIVLAID
jgi:hypothetical protein